MNTTPAQVRQYTTKDGRTIYQLKLNVFPGFSGNAYVIDDGSSPVLVDCGSGQESSDRDLDRCFEIMRSEHGSKIDYEDLSAILITHGHIDHFGGLGHLRERARAPIMIHVLDRRVLTGYEERLAVASFEVKQFLASSGIRPERQDQYLELYLSMKQFFRSVPVEETFEEGEVLGGSLVLHHTPGHCPGHVCVEIGDVLLTGDHLLANISPHIWPERITLHNGLDHYLTSLGKIEAMARVGIGLGGHGGAIADVRKRADEIRREHQKRLGQILELTAEPRTLFELSKEIFGEVRSYHSFLALLETGALVEYLDQRGELTVANFDDIENGRSPAYEFRRI